jgi:hypothetical protein
VLAFAAVAAIAVMSWPHPALAWDIALAAASLLLYALAAIVVLLGWSRPAPRHGLSYRDAAGILVAIVIVVSIQVEPEQLVRLVTAAHNQG